MHSMVVPSTEGTTLVAARRAGRMGIGYDINPEYVEIARERLGRARRRPFAEEEIGITPSPNGVAAGGPIAGDTTEHFQARALREGKKAQDLARDALGNAGFEILRTNPRIARLGIQFNFLVENRHGRRWYVDVSGAFTTVRPGLMRTDTLWKTLGRAHVHHMAGGGTPLLILTSNLPKPGSEGRKALKAVGPKSVFDAIEIFDPDGTRRLGLYGRDDHHRPVEGFWSPEQIQQAFPR